ncbi:ribulose phosphate epimerase [Nannocystis pusilla]|uniref:Ribulose phosphate epimerase n=1 Tax=Nannocystis pusilla TaxID=889268 RepID=A0A9X3IYW2_9BACT|nr:ribulose phosphate epimerase [Nannocystis pusilla]MCY1007994.1 ribulose phosphate epimerase [Nannocystis pusilla]
MRLMPNRLISCALVSALLSACGDDGGKATGATNPNPNTTNNDTTSSGTEGETSTGGPDQTTSTTSTTAPPEPTTTGTSGDSSTTDGSFITPPDGGGGTKECDQWTQDCPEGQKCMPYSGDGDNAWESLKCTPVMENAGQVGDPCTVEGSGVSGIDNCDEGNMCWDVVDGVGVCVALCIGSPDAPDCAAPMTSCLISNDGVLTLCLPFCDPLLQDCPGDDLCIPNPQNPDAFLCVLDASGEEGQEYDACEYINACDKGFTCANPEVALECDTMAIGCCIAFCDVTEAGVCTGQNAECLAWYEAGMAPPGFENVGFCGIPQ